MGRRGSWGELLVSSFEKLWYRDGWGAIRRGSLVEAGPCPSLFSRDL